jgi:uncharacterized membrane protein
MIRLGLRHRPVLVAAAGFGVLIGLLARGFGLAGPSAVLAGWCAGVLGYIVPTFVLMQRSSPESIRRRAETLDDGEAAVLFASLAAAIASIGAVAWHLAAHEGPMAPAQVAVGLFVIALSWTFVHMLFAVRYAHEYWQLDGGLEFPGEERPVFNDFLYFALTIGMTFQTSDVAITAPLLRNLALVHALVSFLFNVVILAAAVNLAAGLVG